MDDRDRPALRPPCVAMMQPTFLPWQGYFGLAAAADVFVLLDDFQFVRRSFHHRNRLLFADEGPATVSVPVRKAPGGNEPELRAAETVIDAKWRRHLQAKLDHAYRSAPFHDSVRGPVDAWLEEDWPSLAAMNVAFIRMVAEMLRFAPRWVLSSELASSGKRSERNIDLLRRVGARTYLAARGSFDYMLDDGCFPVDDIEVVFQDFVPEPYPQRRTDEFVSHLSVLDALFEVGAHRTRDLVLQGQRAWVSWDTMVAMADATRVAP